MQDAFLSLKQSFILQILKSDVTSHKDHLAFRQHTDCNTVQLFPLVALAPVPRSKDVFRNVSNIQLGWLLARIIPLAQCNIAACVDIVTGCTLFLAGVWKGTVVFWGNIFV